MPQIDIKIQSVADLAALKKAIDEVGRGEAAVKRFKQEGSGVGELFRLGFGIGSGIELARRGLDIFKATIVDTARDAFVMADAIKDGAEALSITRKEYQVLGQAMQDAGGDQARMAQAISTNNRSLIEARTQAGAAAAAYRTLGLSPAALEGLSVPKRLEAIARAIDSAKDKTEAFSAAGDILGSRDLPVLLSALRQLGTDGYDALADKMDKAGKIMSDGTIERLERAKKSIESFKKSMTIEVGEAIGGLDILKESLQKNFGETFLGILRAGLFRDYSAISAAVIKNVPSVTAAPPPAADNTAAGAAAAALEAKLIELKKTKLDLLKEELANDDQQKSILLTAEEKRAAELDFLYNKFKLLSKIRDLTTSLPLEGKDPAARAEELARLEAQILATNTEATNKGAPLSDATKRNRSFDTFNSGKNAEGGAALSPMDGITAGLQDGITQFGSAGEQIANTIKGTIGAAVSGISDGIYGWITGTQTWGQAMLQMGRTVLKGIIDNVVQIGIQQIINGNIFKSVMIATDALSNALRIGRVAKDNAAEAATLPLKTAGAAAAGISSYGVALAFGAIAIALIAAAAGGFQVGGYTTPGPSDRPAGVVHAGEWVAPQWMAKDPVYGAIIQSLEGVRTGQRGFKTGGWLGKMLTTGIDDKLLSYFKGSDAKTEIIADTRTAYQRSLTEDGFAAATKPPAYEPQAAARGGSSSSIADAGGPSVNVPVTLAVFDSRQSAEDFIRSQPGQALIFDIGQKSMIDRT